MPQSIKQKTILIFSIVLSIFIHVVEIYFLKHSSLWFATSSVSEAKIVDWTVAMGKTERNQILKETFEAPWTRDVSAAHKEALPRPVALQKIETAHLKIEEYVQALPPLLPSFPKTVRDLTHAMSFPILQREKTNFFADLPQDLSMSSLSEAPPATLPSLIALIPSSQGKPEIPSPTSPGSSVIPAFPTRKEAVRIAPAATLSLLPQLPRIPSLHDLQIVSCSDAFDVELSFIEEKQDGYLFALTIIAGADLKIPPLKQNYIFLIDRSNSIQSERLTATKNAVRKAIDDLDPQDRFNVIAFDQGVEKFSPQCLSATPENLAKARNFLDRIELGSFFSQADLYKPLFLTTPFSVKEDELYTAILLSDGESLGKKGTSSLLLNDWTQQNQGKVALYSVGMEGDFHSSTLETLCACNRGKMSAASTHRGMKRKLLRQMKTLHAPIAKNLSCKAIPVSSEGAIEILPQATQAPHLFMEEPYVIFGKTKTLDDFVLFVQGHLNGKWLHIKKTISFLHAKKGSPSLKKQWALHKALDLYQQFLIEGNPKFFAEAHHLVQTHDLWAKFE